MWNAIFNFESHNMEGEICGLKWFMWLKVIMLIILLHKWIQNFRVKYRSKWYVVSWIKFLLSWNLSQDELVKGDCVGVFRRD